MSGRILYHEAVGQAAGQPETEAERRGRRLARGLTVLCALLIVAGSLFPAHYVSSARLIRHHWFVFIFMSLRLAFQSYLLGDLITNYLLYLPFGLLAPWALPAKASRGQRWRLALAAPLLSLLLESAQTLTTNRSASLGDSLMNSLGYLTGYLLMTRTILVHRLSPAIFIGRRGRMPRAALARALRQVYLVLFILLSLAPYHFSLNPRRIQEKMAPGHGVRQGRVLLSLESPWDRGRMQGIGMMLAVFIPYGFFSRLSRPGRGRHEGWRIGLTGAGLASALEVAQLCEVHRTSDLAQCVAGGLGAAFGAILARLWDRMAAAPGETAPPAPDPALVALAGWLTLLLTIAWWPFRFIGSGQDVADRLIRQANWIPFIQFITRRAPADWVHLASETALYLPLGMLLAAWLRRRGAAWSSRSRWLAAIALAVTASVALELSQGLVYGHTVDSTDMIGHLCGALAGYGLGLILSPPRESPEIKKS